MSRPTNTVWTATTRPTNTKSDFKLKARRPEEYIIRVMDLQVIRWYDSSYGVKINQMSASAKTFWEESP